MAIIDQLTPSSNPLPSFAGRPLEIFFESEERDEEVILMVRSHPITLIPRVLLIFLLFLLPMTFAFLLTAFRVDFDLYMIIPPGYRFILTLGWYLFIFSFAFETFLQWYFNVLIVTTRRVVDIDFYGLMYKHVADVDLSKIQDVSYHIGGFIRVLFNFGNLDVQTAAEQQHVEMIDIPHPDRVTQLISELSNREEQQDNQGGIHG